METVCGKLTIYFDEPFWVGVFERRMNGQLQVCRVVFGSEPTDCQIHEFVLRQWRQLRFSSLSTDSESLNKRVNPKRLSRQVRKETQLSGIGTKAQQAIKNQMEMNKKDNQEKNRLKKEECLNRLHQLRQQKHKEKHKGH